MRCRSELLRGQARVRVFAGGGICCDGGRSAATLPRGGQGMLRIPINAGVAAGAPAWVEVDLGAVAHNVREFRRVLRPSCGEQPTGSILTLALRSLARTQSHLMLLGRRNANERMAAFLIDLAARQGDESSVYLPMQRYDIADYLGMTFETVSRVLRALKDLGFIRLRSTNEVELLDVTALEAMCD